MDFITFERDASQNNIISFRWQQKANFVAFGICFDVNMAIKP